MVSLFTILFTLCSFSLSDLALGGSNDSVSEATEAGESCGKSIKALYTQYKEDGKLDFSNASNLINVASLANSISKIKDQDKDTDFYKEFAAGVVSGSMQTVSDSNVNDVISALSDIDLGSIGKAQENSSETASDKGKKVAALLGGAAKSGNSNSSESDNQAGSQLNDLFNNLFGK